MASIFFHGRARLGRTLILAVCAYGALVLLLRISGKRTLSRMHVFDFVFVVALGSTLANTVVSSDVSLTEGVAAFVALIALQVLLSRLVVCSHWLETVINGEPTLLFYQGRFLRETIRREGVTVEDLRAAVRSQGIPDMNAVEAVVLETDGTFSVVARDRGETPSSPSSTNSTNSSFADVLL